MTLSVDPRIVVIALTPAAGSDATICDAAVFEPPLFPARLRPCRSRLKVSRVYQHNDFVHRAATKDVDFRVKRGALRQLTFFITILSYDFDPANDILIELC